MSNVRIVGSKNTPVMVSDDGKLFALSEARSQLQHALTHGRAFNLLAEVDLTDTSLTPMLWLQNDDSREGWMLVIDEIILSADANVHFELFFGEGYTSGGAAATPQNLNRGSTLTADVTAKDGSAALVLDAEGTEFQSLYVGSYSPYVEVVNIALAKAKTIAIKAQGANTNKCRAHVKFYFADFSRED